MPTHRFLHFSRRLGISVAVFFLCSVSELHAQKYCVTLDATDIGLYSATVHARLSIPHLGSFVKSYGIQLSTHKGTPASSGTLYESKELESGNTFSIPLTQLYGNTVYYYRAYVYDGSIYHVGEWKSFQTLKASASITLDEPTEITSFGAEFVAHVRLETPEWADVNYGFYISETDSLPSDIYYKGKRLSSNKGQTRSGNFKYWHTESSLAINHRYHVVAYYTVTGTAYLSNVVSFSTLDVQPVDMGLPSGTKWTPINLGVTRISDTGNDPEISV